MPKNPSCAPMLCTQRGGGGFAAPTIIKRGSRRSGWDPTRMPAPASCTCKKPNLAPAAFPLNQIITVRGTAGTASAAIKDAMVSSGCCRRGRSPQCDRSYASVAPPQQEPSARPTTQHPTIRDRPRRPTPPKLGEASQGAGDGGKGQALGVEPSRTIGATCCNGLPLHSRRWLNLGSRLYFSLMCHPLGCRIPTSLAVASLSARYTPRNMHLTHRINKRRRDICRAHLHVLLLLEHAGAQRARALRAACASLHSAALLLLICLSS